LNVIYEICDHENPQISGVKQAPVSISKCPNNLSKGIIITLQKKYQYLIINSEVDINNNELNIKIIPFNTLAKTKK